MSEFTWNSLLLATETAIIYAYAERAKLAKITLDSFTMLST